VHLLVYATRQHYRGTSSTRPPCWGHGQGKTVHTGISVWHARVYINPVRLPMQGAPVSPIFPAHIHSYRSFPKATYGNTTSFVRQDNLPRVPRWPRRWKHLDLLLRNSLSNVFVCLGFVCRPRLSQISMSASRLSFWRRREMCFRYCQARPNRGREKRHVWVCVARVVSIVSPAT